MHTLLKYHIYEFCISVFFDEMEKNLTDYSANLPSIGEKFSRIVDTFTGDIFVGCTIIHMTDLGYWNELEIEECKNFAFAIRFKTWFDNDGIISNTVDNDIYDEIHFDKKNLVTLMFEK